MKDAGRRRFISALAGGAALAWGSGMKARAASRPNVLIYIADDQYTASVGCYGAEPSHTPNIDRLASEGMRFTHAFTPSSICTPSRGALISGLYPVRNGAHPNHSGFKDGVKSLPNYMADLGYRAALVGKDGIQRPSDLYDWETRIEKTDEHVPGADEPEHDRHRKTDLSAVERFVAADRSRPFCLVHAASLPHSPYLNPLPNGLAGYDASNYYMDFELGAMLDILQRNALAENTIVIYVNDNGAGLDRSKFTLYDIGVRVPMVIRWPGRVRPGSVSDAMVSFVDILPTLLEAVGGRAPNDLDGRSALGVLEGNAQEHHQELYFTHTSVSVASNRLETIYPIRGVRTRRHKYIRNLNHTIPHPKRSKEDNEVLLPYEELYDLASDPDEDVNLADAAELQDIRKQLSDKVDAWMKQQGDLGIATEREAITRFPPKKKPD
jgi:N-sulfoglucosamine sulfohydrolase